MKYSMVRQFSNNGIDNIFKFFFKISDFGKLLLDTFLAFLDIWFTFYMIFYNFLMYFYYLLLFFVERGTESDSTGFIWKRSLGRASYNPKIEITSGPNPIPAMYGAARSTASSAASAASSAAKTASSAMSSMSTPLKGAKIPFTRRFLETLYDFFGAIKRMIISPFKLIYNFFIRTTSPLHDEEERRSQRGKSLIDEYMKEYEQSRR